MNRFQPEKDPLEALLKTFSVGKHAAQWLSKLLVGSYVGDKTHSC